MPATDDLPDSCTHPENITDAAVMVADWIGPPAYRNFTAATVDVEPGDATRYRFIISPPCHVTGRTNDWHIALVQDFGTVYPWNGQYVHWSYASNWCARGHENEHTQRVIAGFLNALAAELTDRGWFA